MHLKGLSRVFLALQSTYSILTAPATIASATETNISLNNINVLAAETVNYRIPGTS